MDFAGINYIAILIAAVVSFIFGAVWYGTLGKPWMAAIGKTGGSAQGSECWISDTTRIRDSD